MARIPQYNRSVTPQNTPYSYIQSHATPEAFGVGVSNAMGKLSEAGNRMLGGMVSLKEQYDRTKLLEFGNFIDRWSNENLYDKDNGYFYKTGKEAMGKSPELLESFDKYADEYISKAGFVGDAHQRAMQIVFQKRNTIEQQIERHDKQETDRWQDTVYSDSLSNVFNKAIQDRNNPYNLNMYYRDGMTVLDNYAAVKGWINDPEMMAIKKKEFAGNFHAQVLDAYLAEGSLKAGEYFEQHKESFSPDVQNKYLNRIHNEEVNYAARNAAQNLAMMSPDEAYRYIDSIENIDVRNATESEYNRLIRQKDMLQKQIDIQRSNEIMQRVYAAYDEGNDISSIMREVNISDMSLEQKEKIYKNLKTMQELSGVGNNWADYNILLDMAAFNNEEFKNINPANYNLTKEQYNKIVEMQRKTANNEYTPEVEMRKAINGMFDNGFNYQWKEGLHSKEYEDEVVRFLSKVERMQGEAFDFKNTEQLQAILEGFDYKDTSWKDDDTLNKEQKRIKENLDETKELFARAKKHGEVYDLMAREYMMFKGANKREPLPEEIYEMAKRSYNTIENAWRERDMGKLNSAQGVYKNISATKAKKGETKVLTYYADIKIPQISRELGIPLQITSRYRAGDPGGHGKGRKCDVGMAALNPAQRERVFVRLLSEPAVASIGTSDRELLNKYNKPKNPKIRDLRGYDADYKKVHPNTTMNHENHIDISFDTRYGGDIQGQ